MAKNKIGCRRTGLWVWSEALISRTNQNPIRFIEDKGYVVSVEMTMHLSDATQLFCARIIGRGMLLVKKISGSES
ncbi:hypothetical protein D4S03_04760 [bacterium]|nr:MAG: hypothetical protein D4S03_04760 [bacterium]